MLPSVTWLNPALLMRCGPLSFRLIPRWTLFAMIGDIRSCAAGSRCSQKNSGTSTTWGTTRWSSIEGGSILRIRRLDLALRLLVTSRRRLGHCVILRRRLQRPETEVLMRVAIRDRSMKQRTFDGRTSGATPSGRSHESLAQTH
jgi:hypothetical protein